MACRRRAPLVSLLLVAAVLRLTWVTAPGHVSKNDSAFLESFPVARQWKPLLSGRAPRPQGSVVPLQELHIRQPRQQALRSQRSIGVSRQGVFAEVVEIIESQPSLFIGEIAAVVVLSAIFEAADHWVRGKLKEYGDDTGSQIVDALFKEVTVLGFIGLLLFLTTRSGTADSLAAFIYGVRDWSAESENPLAETFETVHIMIFLLLVVLLFQAGAILVVTRQVSRRWGDYESSRGFGMTPESLESKFVEAGYIERVPNPAAPRGVDLIMTKPFDYGVDIWDRLQKRRSDLNKLIMYRAIRHEFLYPRREHRKTTASVRDPALFSFESYLEKRLGKTVLALVEVSASTWLISIVALAPIIYFCVGKPAVFIRGVQCLCAWFLVACAALLTVLLEEDTYKFTPQVPSDPRQTLRLFSGTSTQMLRRASQYAKSSEGAARIAGVNGKSSRPGLGGIENQKKALLIKPPFFNGDSQTFLSALAYEQLFRLISFFQAVSLTSLIVCFFNSPPQTLIEGVLYALSWCEWPVMLFFVVPVLMRRLTFRNSIEGKKDVRTMRQVAGEGNRGLIRDFVVLVRLMGLGQRSHELEAHHDPHHDRASIIAKVDEHNATFELKSQSEQLEIWNIYAVWDVDNDGEVILPEVVQTFQTMGFDKQIAEQSATNLLRLVDEDGTNIFTWRKVKALAVMAQSVKPTDSLDADMTAFFDLVDINGDGKVTAKEMTLAMRRMRIGLQTEDIANLLYEHFREAKLAVTREEFCEWTRAMSSPVVVA